jgi:hypothetical protein
VAQDKNIFPLLPAAPAIFCCGGGAFQCDKSVLVKSKGTAQEITNDIEAVLRKIE